MGAFLGKGKAAPARDVSAQDRAVLSLKTQRDKLKQYQVKIQVVLDKEREMARQLAKQGDKKRALLCLQRKRYQEELLAKTDQQLSNLEQMVATIEFAQIEVKVVEGLKLGNEVLKELNSQLRVEDIEQLMAETEDARAQREEISAALAAKLTDADEEAINAELEAMLETAENAVVQDDTEAADLEAAMPSVPTTVPARAADEEDEEEEEEPEAASVGKARARQAVPA